MKANELMVGDYVIRKNILKEILIVIAIDSIRNVVYLDLDGLGITEKIENIEPIPLTAEILEKNGFQQISTNKYVSGTVTIAIFVEEFLITIKSLGARVMITIKYIHELQHALQLCNIDKEIEL